MAGSRSMRFVQAALRCYPRRWQSRHGEEAAELARLLIRDGTPARSIAWSYFKGAASARLVLQPRRRLGAAVGALLAAACSLGVSLALLSSSAPASAANHRPSHEGRHCVAEGTAGSSVPIRVTANKPASDSVVSSHGQHC
jgi:hypothetical protein